MPDFTKGDAMPEIEVELGLGEIHGLVEFRR